MSRFKALDLHVSGALLEMRELDERHDADDERDDTGHRDSGEDLDAEGQCQQGGRDRQCHEGSVRWEMSASPSSAEPFRAEVQMIER